MFLPHVNNLMYFICNFLMISVIVRSLLFIVIYNVTTVYHKQNYQNVLFLGIKQAVFIP